MHPDHRNTEDLPGQERIPRLPLIRLRRIWSDAPTTWVRAGGGGTKKRRKHRRATGTRSGPLDGSGVAGSRWLPKAGRRYALNGRLSSPVRAAALPSYVNGISLSANGEKNGH